MYLPNLVYRTFVSATVSNDHQYTALILQGQTFITRARPVTYTGSIQTHFLRFHWKQGNSKKVGSFAESLFCGNGSKKDDFRVPIILLSP